MAWLSVTHFRRDASLATIPTIPKHPSRVKCFWLNCSIVLKITNLNYKHFLPTLYHIKYNLRLFYLFHYFLFYILSCNL